MDAGTAVFFFWCGIVTATVGLRYPAFGLASFAVVLVLESLPFLSAVAIAILESSRINTFSFWRDSAVRTAELIGLRPVILPTALRAPTKVSSEVHHDAN